MLGIIMQVPAVADSSMAALNAQNEIGAILQASLPWLAPAVVLWLSKLLASFPIVSMIFTWEWVAKKAREASPWLNEHVGKRLEKWAWLVNPVLGMLIGTKMGDPILGLAGGALWGMIRSAVSGFTGGRVDPANALKVKAGAALIACSLLLGAGSASAADQSGVPLLSRFTFSAGAGVQRDLVGEAPVVGFAAVQPGFTVNNHVALRLRLSRPFEATPKWRGELAAWFVF